MVAILPYLERNPVYDPEALRIMSQAFDDACNVLHVFSGDQHGRETIARGIIDLASTGVIDPSALRDRVLQEARTDA